MLRRLTTCLALTAVLTALPALAQSDTDLPDAPEPAAIDTAEQVADARASAEEWLAIVDRGDFAESWSAGAQMFQEQVSQEQWVQQVQQVEAQAGALQERTFANGQYTTTLPGLPEGQYMVLTYGSSFDSLQAQELIVMAMEDGEWKTAGYVVRPAQAGQ